MLVQSRDVDVGAGRFTDRMVPARPQPGDATLASSALPSRSIVTPVSANRCMKASIAPLVLAPPDVERAPLGCSIPGSRK